MRIKTVIFMILGLMLMCSAASATVVVNYTYENDTASLITDDSVNGYDAVNYGITSSVLPSGYPAGIYNGSNYAITQPFAIASVNRTFEILLYMNGNQSDYSGIFLQQDPAMLNGANKNVSGVFFGTSNNLTINVGDGVNFANTNYKLVPNNWYLIDGVIVGGSKIYLYVNGVEVANKSISYNPATSDRVVVLGNLAGTKFKGAMAYATLFNTALSPSDIMNNYNNTSVILNDPMYNLQAYINLQTSLGAVSNITSEYDGGFGRMYLSDQHYVINVPSNASIIGNGYNIKNTSFVINGQSNITISNVLSENSKHNSNFIYSPFTVYNNSSNIIISRCHVANAQTGKPAYNVISDNLTNITFIDCIANDTDSHGFQVDYNDSAHYQYVNNITFINCTASYCGFNTRMHQWVTGFALDGIEPDVHYTMFIDSMLFENCTAKYNWESGFHTEGYISVSNSSFINCSSSHNGVKPDARWGAGYVIQDCFELINDTSDSNVYGYYICKILGSSNNITILDGCLDNNSSHTGVYVYGAAFLPDWYDYGTLYLKNHTSINSGSRSYMPSGYELIDNIKDASLNINNTKCVYVTNYTAINADGNLSSIHLNYVKDSMFDINSVSNNSYGVYAAHASNCTFSGQVENDGYAAFGIENANDEDIIFENLNISGARSCGVVVSSTTANLNILSGHITNKFGDYTIGSVCNLNNTGQVNVTTPNMKITTKPYYYGNVNFGPTTVQFNTSGTMIAPATVYFNSTCENATSWGWTFNDASVSTGQNTLSILNLVGNNTINVDVFDAEGNFLNYKTQYVTVQSPFTTVVDGGNVTTNVYKYDIGHVIWKESSDDHSAITLHTIGGFPANTDIDIYRDGIDYDTVRSNSTGYITWVYDGGFSEHTFEAIPHATAGMRDSFVSSWSNTVSMVGAIIVIALAGSMIMMFRGKKDLSEVMNDLPGIILIVVLMVTGAIIFGQF